MRVWRQKRESPLPRQAWPVPGSKIWIKCLPKAPSYPGILVLWLIFQKRGNRERISGECSWGRVVEKVKRKKKKPIKHFLIRQEACVLGCGGQGENLSSECWAKVQGHFWMCPNNFSRCCWHMADLGFGVLARTRASGIQHKTFPVSEREKMKKAEFLGLAAKGEADAEQRKEGT